MTTLSDFDEKPDTSLEDFGLGNEKKPVTNRASDVNLAANASLLKDGGNVVDTFKTISAENTQDGSSRTADAVLEESRKRASDRAKVAMGEVLADPELSDDQKQEIIDHYQNDFGYVDVMDMVAEEALIAESSPTDNVEVEFSRGNSAEVIDSVNQHKKQTQAIINGLALSNDSSMSSNVVDFLEFMLPFAEGGHVSRVLAELNDESGLDKANTIKKGFLALGATKRDLANTFMRLPPEKRLEAAYKLANIVATHSQVVLPDGNNFAVMNVLQTALEVGSYSGLEEFVDNVTSVLDLVGAGALVRTVTRNSKTGKVVNGTTDATSTTKKTEELVEETIPEDLVSDVQRRNMKTKVQPSSPSQILKDTNANKARAAHEMAVADKTEEAAGALYGTTRTEAIVNDLLPEVDELRGTVKNKVSNADKFYKAGITPDPEIMDFVHIDGALYGWREDKIAARTAVVNDFKNAVGVTTRDDMFQVVNKTDGSGITVKGVYGPTEGGFKSPQEALDLVKFAFRSRGVGDDSITLLARSGEDYKPTTIKDELAKEVIANTFRKQKKRIPEEFKPAIDYKVKVDYDYSFDISDATLAGKVDTKFNVFDRVKSIFADNFGSPQRHLLDVGAFLDSRLVGGASVAVDKAAGLEKQLTEVGKIFSRGYASLSKEKQAVMFEFIKEANAQAIEFNVVNMTARGFNKNEQNILMTWKEIWDTVYWLENRDLIKTMKANKFQVFHDGTTDTRLFVRPVSEKSLGGSVKVYNQIDDTIRTISGPELKQFYENGGTIAKLAKYAKVGDEAIEFIAVENKVNSGYLRALNDSDVVLNYRKGYYQVHYKDPKFIIRVDKDSSGRVIGERAVGTAGSTKDADLMVQRFTSTEGGEYYHRGDVKGMKDSDRMDMQVSSGRTAQKMRGQRLEDSTSGITDTSHEHILDPIEALTKSIRSVSRRVSMRDYMEAYKKRFKNQFGEMFPKDQFGNPRWPNNSSEIGKPGQASSKDLADARSNFEYINYLENGYINHIDDAVKAIVNTMADIAGNAGLTRAEKVAIYVGDARGPSALMRSIAFNAYLASNPLRQVIVQSHQITQLAANFNPEYVLKSAPQALVLAAKLRGFDKVSKKALALAGWTQEELDVVYKEYKRTGLQAAVDVNNLVRADLTKLAENTTLGKIGEAAKTPLTMSRKIGFDAGEQANIMVAWLVHRADTLKGQKRALTAEEVDQATASARNYTYNMNFAGDLPYNQNALSAAFQFLQVPHKALTTMTLNRGLTPAQKGRLVAFNTLLYGVPVGFVANWFKDMLPENREVRDSIEFGLETVVLNKLISLSTGTDTRIDFTNLAPNDIHGFASNLVEFIANPSTYLASSPSGQLFFGNNPKVTQSFRTASRYFNLIDDYENPTEFSDVAKSFANISSGFSNAFKAHYMWEYGQKLSSSGDISDESVTKPEAIAQIFGFGTLDEASSYKIKNELYQKSSQYTNDVKSWYNELKRHLSRKGMSTEDEDYALRTMSEAWRVFSKVDDNKAKEIVVSLIKKDASNNDATLIKRVMESMGWMDESEVRRMILDLPEDQKDKRESLLKVLDHIKSYKEE